MKTIIQQPSPQTDLHGWAAVRYFAERAQQFEHASLACRVMAGFELNELYATHAQQGKRTDIHEAAGKELAKPWQQWCREDGGISDDLARLWMNMASAARERFSKLRGEQRLRALMETPVNDWKEDDRLALQESLSKITTATTQADFMRDLGIGPARGGWNRGQTGGTRSPMAPEKKRDVAEEYVGDVIGKMKLLQQTMTLAEISTPTLYRLDDERVKLGKFIASMLKDRKAKR